MTINDVIKWCDEQSQDGKEVSICWEGGGDSGWVFMEVDGEQPSADEADWLIDKMCDILDYGSWAGEFNASGRATYDSESKTFDGEDIYSEDETDVLTLSGNDVILIKIPKKFYFETLTVEFENVLDGGGVDIRPRIRNGILSKELIELCKSLEKEVEEKAYDLLNENTKSEWSGYHTLDFGKQDIKEAGEIDPDFYVFEITELEYMTQSEDVRGVSIDLNEYAEELNDTEL